MTTLIATAVIRDGCRGDGHGGVYLIDLERQRVKQAIDRSRTDMDRQGRSWDRGLRGVEFDEERVFIAASDALFVFSPDFELVASYACPYLEHCHEICRFERRLYLTSAGFDSILGFDLDQNRFSLGLHIRSRDERVAVASFDPNESRGPAPNNKLHLNSVHCDARGMYVSGARTEAIFIYGGKSIDRYAAVPRGAHNARPFREGIVFNDSEADVVRYVAPGDQRIFAVPRYAEADLTHADMSASDTARQAFGRGLCAIDDHVIAAGSSPATIALHNLETMKTMVRINLTMDVRASIHSLAVWPYPLLADA